MGKAQQRSAIAMKTLIMKMLHPVSAVMFAFLLPKPRIIHLLVMNKGSQSMRCEDSPLYVRRQIQYANEQRLSNRENNGGKKERKRCLEIQKRLTNTSDPLRRDVLEPNKHKPTPTRHQMCMDLLSDEEEE
jgi:hypothetical protein